MTARTSLVALVASLLVTSLASCSDKTPSRKGTIIAHRGASGYLPEHTLEGAAMAHSWNVDFIEPDVVMTKDNHLVLLHDIHIDTTTNVKDLFPARVRDDGRFYAIDFTLEEIKRLRVHERTSGGKAKYPGRFPLYQSSFEVPTFVEFVQLVQGLNRSRGQNVGLYVEFKSPKFHREAGKDILARLMKELYAAGYPDRPEPVIIQCFDPKSLIRLEKEFGSGFPTVQLIAENEWGESDADYAAMLKPEGVATIATYADGVGPWFGQLISWKSKYGIGLNKTLMTEFKKHDLFVHPYTVRKDEIPFGVTGFNGVMSVLFDDLGVDGVFTDFGDLGMKFLGR